MAEYVEVEEESLEQTGEKPPRHQEHADTEVEEVCGREQIHPEGAAIVTDVKQRAAGDDAKGEQCQSGHPADHPLGKI